MTQISLSNSVPAVERSTRHYRIADVTVQVEADLPFTDRTFAPKFERFRVPHSAEERIRLHHHFSLPAFDLPGSAQNVYMAAPWAVYRTRESWIYAGISDVPGDSRRWITAVFDLDHTAADIFSPGDGAFRAGNLSSLSMFPTDQIWLAEVLADRRGCYVHASGMIIEGQGFLFVGHSDAGKSTTVEMLREEGEILCDDRMIIRRWPDGFRVHGTWSHGDIPQVSPASAPLRAVLLLEKASTNQLIRLNPREVVRELPFFVVKPLVTATWWEKTLDLVGDVAREVPVYRLRLDRSGQVARVVKQLLAE